MSTSTLNTRNPTATLQRMRLIGPGDDYFAKALDAIKTIHQLHAEALSDTMLIPWAPTFIGPYPAIEAGTRIITFDEHQELPKIPIPRNIDPYNILANLEATRRYSYSSHNEVRYREALTSKTEQ